MQILINIDEKDKKYIDRVVDNSCLVKPTVDAILNAVRNGTPLPKGHGDLIDRNEINIPYDICDGVEAMCYVNEASPIIEADKKRG